MKKKGIIVVTVGVVIVGIFVTIFYLMPAREETRASESKLLSVDRVFDGMKIKNGTAALKGKYSGPDDAKLYYLVSSEDKHVIGSDAITMESDKTFTVNLTLATSNTNKRGEIKIYSQNAQGQVVDVVNIKVTLD